MELPIYELKISDDINDDAEVNFVSMVDRPAVQRNWSAFKEYTKFQIANEDRRIVSGVIMLADTPIYRNDDFNGEYFVVFSKDTIYKIVQRYFKKGFQNNVNLNHNHKLLVDNTSLFESFISDSERGILPMKGYEDVPEGSWFGSMYVENDDAWSRVKSKEINGFSVEGIFEYVKKSAPQKNILQEIINILSSVDFGGEGSGCHGSNCGRPEGSGSDSNTGGGVNDITPDSKELADLVERAKISAPEVDKLGRDLAKKYGADITPINLKQPDSIMRKANDEEGGNLANIKDAVRNTIIHPDPKTIESLINDLSKDKRFMRVKKQLHEENPLGYNGNIVNVKLANGTIGEIQVNTPKMIYAKEKPADAKRILGEKKYNEISKQTGIEGGRGHAIYEVYRKLDPKKDKKRILELQKESKAYYKNFLG